LEEWTDRDEGDTLPRSPAYAECDTASRMDQWVSRNWRWIAPLALVLVMFAIALAAKD
jgi:hypothetical protein